MKLGDLIPTRLLMMKQAVAGVLSMVVAASCLAWPQAPAPSQALSSLDGATTWLNSPPLDAQALRKGLRAHAFTFG